MCSFFCDLSVYKLCLSDIRILKTKILYDLKSTISNCATNIKLVIIFSYRKNYFRFKCKPFYIAVCSNHTGIEAIGYCTISLIADNTSSILVRVYRMREPMLSTTRVTMGRTRWWALSRNWPHASSWL